MKLDPQDTILEFVFLVYSDYDIKSIFGEVGVEIPKDLKDIGIFDLGYFDYIYELWAKSTPDEWIAIAIEMLIHPPQRDWLTPKLQPELKSRLDILLMEWAYEKPLQVITSAVKASHSVEAHTVTKGLLTMFVKEKSETLLQESLDKGMITADEYKMARELAGY